jgi:predicted MFS family arabinose efflux permease
MTLVTLLKNSFAGLSKEIWMLSLVTLINRIGAMVLPFLSVYLGTIIGFDITEVAWIMSAYGIGSMIGSLIGGKLSNYFGFLKVMIGSLILSSFAFIGLLYLESFYQWLFFVMLATMITDSFRPANFLAMDAYSTKENKTRSISLVRLMINLGIGIGPFIGGYLAVKFGYSWLFIIDAVSCLFAALFLYVKLGNVKIIKEEAKILDVDFAEQPQGLEGSSNKNAKGKSPYRDGPFLFYMFLLFISTVSFAQLIFTLPYFLKTALGFDEDIIGTLLGINGLLIFVFEMPLIYLLENKVKSKNLITIGAFMIGLSYLILIGIGAYTTTLMYFILLISIILITFGEIINFPYVNVKILAMAEGNKKEDYIGLYTMMWPTAMILASPLGFNVADQFGWNTLWALMMTLSTIAAVGFYFFDDLFLHNTSSDIE